MQQNFHQNLDLLYVKENRCSFPYNGTIIKIAILLILMFGIWTIIIISIIIKKYAYLIIIIPIYTIYNLIECYSNKNLFKEQKTPEDMKTLIGNLFTSLPSIKLICEIDEIKTRTDFEGNKENYDEYIGSEYKYLKILSSRDVRGVLNLDYEGYFMPIRSRN